MNNSRFTALVFGFFFLSGAAGIVYEVVWTRLLALVMGNTHFSIATVLTAFMGGLALGSYWGGKMIDRVKNPLRVYAILEAALGVYCLAIPFLIDGAFPLFQWIHQNFSERYFEASLLRFAVCAAILILPTTLMGATLPTLGKFLARDERFIGKDVGTLYAVNTFGAMTGALAAAYLLMRHFGVHGALYLAAGTNLSIALAIFIFLNKPPSLVEQSEDVARNQPDESFTSSPNIVAVTLICFGLSGATAMVYQLAWTRIFSLLLGSSVYAFSLILATFILGLALGTSFLARKGRWFGDPVKTFGLTQLGIGFFALAGLPFFEKIPFFNRWVYQNWGQEFSVAQGSNFLAILAFLLLPTFLMGAQFPLAIKIVARKLEDLGGQVGRVYASNTVGAILGSFLGGFIFIPLVGVQDAILCAVLLNVVLGIVLLAFSKSVLAAAKYYVLPAILFLVVWAGNAIPKWDKAIISSGSFMPYRIEELEEAVQQRNKILYYKEGIHTTVTTELANSGNIFLRVNGKTDASLALDMRTQLLSGYLPLLLHPKPKTVAVVGQGSGVTLGAVEQFPVKSIDLVEISPAVIEGSQFFSPFNHHSLDDPRVRVRLEDGRNFLALTDKTYDVIVSEPSNPWISGVGALFTRDFFEIVKSKLNPKGVICIWVHTNMSPDDFKSIIKTFNSVFPAVSMWESIVGDDYLLIGSGERYSLSHKTLQAALQGKLTGKDLAGIGVKTPRDLMSLMVMDRRALEKFAGDAPIHTDDNSLLEFNAPEYIYKDERDVLVRQMDPYVKTDPALMDFSDLKGAEREAAMTALRNIPRSESQIGEIKRVARIEGLLDRALEHFQKGAANLALKNYEEILQLNPRHVLTLTNLGNLLSSLDFPGRAETVYRKTIEINPYYIFGHLNLSKLLIASGQSGKAIKLLEPVLEWYAGDKTVWLHLGLAHSFQKSPRQATEYFDRALNEDPDYAEAHYYFGLHLRKTRPGKAKKHLERFLQLAKRKDSVDDKMISQAQKTLRRL